ncbi:MAG: hypothetical protein NVS4B3_05830 [Gemmatimonadaceae bacterium]
MTSSGGLLEYFVLEASEYIEHLDAAVAAVGHAAPDAEAMTRYARAIRGSATMSRQSAIADVAGGIERVSRGVRDGLLMWDRGLQGVVTSAVDALRILLRNVRAWSAADQERAERTAAELARYAPDTSRQRAPTPATASGNSFLVTEVIAIADALDLFALRPSDRNAFAQGMARVRALRGIAAIADLPPLGEVVDEVDRSAKPIELSDSVPTVPQLALFAAASSVLRRLASEMRVLGRPEPSSPELVEFMAAARALSPHDREGDRIVPIDELFPGDGDGLVSAAPNPPTSRTERFRLEVVSQAEHLRRLLADARNARDAASRARVGRELTGALRTLAAAAESFGEHAVAGYAAGSHDGVATLDPNALASLDRVVMLLADPTRGAGNLAGGIAAAGGATDTAPTSGGPSAIPPPARQTGPALPREGRGRTPTGSQLRDLLETGIASIGRLAERPLTPPIPLIDPTLIPIEHLLYRGQAALGRAMAMRDEVRRRGGAPSADEISELFDLVELAAAD